MLVNGSLSSRWENSRFSMHVRQTKGDACGIAWKWKQEEVLPSLMKMKTSVKKQWVSDKIAQIMSFRVIVPFFRLDVTYTIWVISRIKANQPKGRGNGITAAAREKSSRNLKLCVTRRVDNTMCHFCALSSLFSAVSYFSYIFNRRNLATGIWIEK